LLQCGGVLYVKTLEVEMHSHVFKIVGLSLFVGIALGSASSEQSQRDQVSQNQSQCAGYGFQYGTPAFANCMMQIDQRRRAQNDAESAQLWQQGVQMLSPPKQTNCYRQPSGNVYCQ
jgi:hypothetical protein